MKSAPFDYVRPASLDEALALGGEATWIAGGQSLIPMMHLRVAAPELLADITRLPELQIVEEEAEAVTLGALTRHALIEDGRVPDPSAGLMARIAAKIAYRAVRNMGTLGGSLSLADPSADWPACMVALGASVRIAGPSGVREEPVETFLQGPYATALEPGEILVSVRIPRLTGSWGSYKVTRKSGAFADSLAICTLGEVPRLALTGTGSHAQRLPRAEAAIHAGDDALTDAIRADLDEVDPDADGYKRRCHLATVKAAIKEAKG